MPSGQPPAPAWPRDLPAASPAWPQDLPAASPAWPQDLPAAPAGPSTAPLPPVSSAPQSDSSSLDSWYAPRLPAAPPSGPPVALPPPDDPYATRIDGPYALPQGGMGPVQPGGMPNAMLDDLQPAPNWPSSGWPPGGPPRRSRRLIPVAAGASAALAVVVIGVLVFKGQPPQQAPGGGPTPAATSSAASNAAQQNAAARLSALLGQSVTDRGDVINAVVNVRACGTALQQDAQIFATAASSRERLLTRLRNLPGRSALPAAMMRDLAGAWQASAQADTDLAQWTNTKIARGCHTKGTDASLQASYAPDGRATADKKAFARLWDPIANRYGLTAYQWNQL